MFRVVDSRLKVLHTFEHLWYAHSYARQASIGMGKRLCILNAAGICEWDSEDPSVSWRRSQEYLRRLAARPQR